MRTTAIPVWVKRLILRVSGQVPRQPRQELLTAGPHTYGTEHVHLHSWDYSTRITIGDYCSLADEIHVFLGGNHNTRWISTYPFAEGETGESAHGDRTGHPATKGDIIIGNDVWIGSHASIMSGVTVGDGAVVAAFAHVVSDVPPYAIVGGNPARLIRFRFPEDVIQRLLQIRWWEWDTKLVSMSRNILCAEPTLDSLALLEGLRNTGHVQEHRHGP